VTQAFEIGGFAEQVLLHSNNAVRIDATMPLDRACLLGCGGVTGIGASVRTAGVRFGDSVAVVGCGGVGLNAVQGARLAGARQVIAVDIFPGKLDRALRFGATHVVNTAECDPVKQVVELSGGGVDYAIEAVGGNKRTSEQTYAMVGIGGTALMIGAPERGVALEIDVTEMIEQRKSLSGVPLGSVNFKIDIPLFVDFYLQGRLLLDELVSRTIQLKDINDAFEELVAGELARAVVTFD
jgi:S-(hydroxymethyl)glutathione dehydrogenase/alcohol dehydrogenase